MAKPLPKPSFLRTDRPLSLNNLRFHPRRSLTAGIEALTPTEANLLSAGIGRHVIPLKSDWPEILSDLFSLGHVRLVTAGASAFIEKHGSYPMPEFSCSHATLFGDRMELRFQLEKCGRAFAIYPTLDSGANVTECSIHFFSNTGAAMHRIFLSPAGSIEAFERIAEEYRHYGRPEPSSVTSDLYPHPEMSSDADAAQSISTARTTQRKVIRRVQNYEVLRSLYNSQQAGLPLSVSIGTAGCMQTHTGVLRKIQSCAMWACAIDGNTILYIRDTDIAETFVVETITEEGRCLSLHAVDAHGRSVVTLSGSEAERGASSYRWDHLLEGLSDI